ncbi:MAG: hypothetical protein Q7K57_50475 [Burkholderiaceae bacterium]|nr:hypothetical protein [Polaromonas sp.]MDO8776806.1 hypothetical protein [Burkholderiaceae bacterium]
MVKTIFDQTFSPATGGGRPIWIALGSRGAGMMRAAITLAMALSITALSVVLAVHAGQAFGSSGESRILFSALFAAVVVGGHLLIGLMPCGIYRLVATPLALSCLLLSILIHGLYIADQQAARGYQRSPVVKNSSGSVPVSQLMAERAELERKLIRTERMPCSTSCHWRDRSTEVVRRDIGAADQKIEEAKSREAAFKAAQEASEKSRSQVGISTAAKMVGVPPAALELLLAIAMAILLEGLGCVLWTVLLNAKDLRKPPGTERGVHEVINEIQSPAIEVAVAGQAEGRVAERAACALEALEAGFLKGTRVADVRGYFKCAQAEAKEVSKALKLLIAAKIAGAPKESC